MSKFEFQKLELPLQVLNKDIVQESLDTLEYNKNSTQVHRRTNKKLGYYALIAISFATAGYQLHKYFTAREILKNTSLSRPLTTHNFAHRQPKDTADTLKASVKPIVPVYINFYDSIVFLNKIKGKKKVVSKGYDSYIKKNKLIVKVDDNYYNLFCEDLISNYSVGDSIP